MPGTDTLADLAKQALVIAKKARKHGKSLSGDNYYGNRLAALRADAINSFRQLTSRSAGDSAALAELVETTFSSSSDNKTRLEAVRELTVSLGTTWGQLRCSTGFLRSLSPHHSDPGTKGLSSYRRPPDEWLFCGWVVRCFGRHDETTVRDRDHRGLRGLGRFRENQRARWKLFPTIGLDCRSSFGAKVEFVAKH